MFGQKWVKVGRGDHRGGFRERRRKKDAIAGTYFAVKRSKLFASTAGA
jgi:hypothetical protein